MNTLASVTAWRIRPRVLLPRGRWRIISAALGGRGHGGCLGGRGVFIDRHIAYLCRRHRRARFFFDFTVDDIIVVGNWGDRRRH